MAKTQNFILRLFLVLAICAFAWILSPVAYPTLSAGGTAPSETFILSGAVSDESGAPPPQEVAVKLYPGLRQERINEEGGEYRYSFSEGLPAGRYVIAVTHDHYSFAPQEVTLESDQRNVDISGVCVEKGEDIPPEIQVKKDPIIRTIDASSKEVVFTVSLSNQGNEQITMPVRAIEHDLAFAAPSLASDVITFEVGETAKQFSITVKRSQPDLEEQHTVLFFVGQDEHAVVKIAQGVGVARVHFDAASPTDVPKLPEPTVSPGSPEQMNVYLPLLAH